MIDISQIISSAKKYDFNSLENLLNDIETHNLESTLESINYHVNLVNQRLTPKSERVISFRNLLEKYYLERNIQTNIFQNIKTIEFLYNEILNKRNKILGKFKSHEILKTQFSLAHSLYSRILMHSDVIHKSISEGKYKFFENSINAESEYFNGKDLSSHIEELSKVFYMNLIISSYENNWFNKKSLESIVPFELLTIEENEAEIIEKAEISQHLFFNSGLWDITEDLDFRLRFFKNEIVIDEKKIIHTSQIWEDLGNYALIAKTRLERLIVQQTFEASMALYKIDLLNEDDLNYLSIAALFENLYYIDITKDNKLYKNLTINEWVKSLQALREISKTEGFRLINYDIFFKVLAKYGIPKSKNRIVLENFTFRSTSKDLYNTPILRFSNNQILVFPLTMFAPNIFTIISSIFADNKLAIEDKGYDFEDYVFSFLKEQESKIENFKVTQPTFKNNDGEFQYDAIIEWENHIFIIECKNRSIPDTTPMSLKDFKEKSEKYINQLLRLKRGLLSYPKEHNINIKDKIIVPILLNSLPFSLDYTVSDIYFLDFSSFSKFFKSKNLYMKSAFKGEVKNEKIIHSNWSFDKPCIEDFIRFIENPFHVSQLKSNIKEFTTTHTIGNYEISLDRKYIDLQSEEYEQLLQV